MAETNSEQQAFCNICGKELPDGGVELDDLTVACGECADATGEADV